MKKIIINNNFLLSILLNNIVWYDITILQNSNKRVLLNKLFEMRNKTTIIN